MGSQESRDTGQRLLDAAEELFAAGGYANTSLRAITARARANLASVHYHFGSKEALMDAVLQRRLVPLNRLRRQRLVEVMQAAEASGQRPAVRALVQAFVEPTLAFRSTGARAFVVLISRALSDPEPTVRAAFLRLIAPLLEYFCQCLAAALPDLSRPELFWRFHFLMGSLAHVMHGLDKKDLFPAGMMPADPAALVEMLLAFLVAGMEAPSWEKP
jgi:AcrR family transcriptional regulator